ncbi:MAG: twin-arginine translocase subunit TatC [Desulfobacterales bacterium]|nr:twin-arginine translocase subunit TatC [Desulfobacterales bacterium]
MDENTQIPFTAHLDELRLRLIRCVIAIGIGFVIAYFFKERLFQILIDPLVKALPSGNKLIFTGISEAFFTYLKVALLAGVMIATPVIFFEFWMFVAPGLYEHEKKILFPIIFLSSFFFIGGVLFGYFVVFPLGFQFFLSFATDTIQAMPSMKEYLSFSATMLLVFGAVFELPLIITCLAHIGIVSVSMLKTNRKYAILIIFIVAAILTPPDVVSQILMAIPMMILYELSIFGAKIFSKKKTDAN